MNKAQQFAKAIEDSVADGGLFGHYTHTNGQKYITYNGEFFKDDTVYLNDDTF